MGCSIPPRLTRIFLSLLILGSVVALVFSSCTRHGFVNWDDQSEIVENPDFNPVSWNGLAWNWSHTRLTLYMPITYMVWGATAAVAHRDAAGVLLPGSFHLLNLILHGISAALVFLLIFQLYKRAWPALLGALVFATHPLVAEPVAWASGMYTLLSAALSLGALIAYVALARTAERGKTLKSALFFGTGLILYTLALLTKAASVSLPLAAAGVDLYILARPPRKVLRSISLWIWVVMGIPIVLLAKHFQDVSQITAPPFWGRPVIALDAMGFYLRKIALPIDLIPDYGRNPHWVMQHPAAATTSAITALAALLLAWFASRQGARANRLSAQGITASVGLLIAGVSPYLGLTTFDFQYVSTVADRYAYFGLVGAAVAAAAIAARYRGMAIVLIALVCVFGFLTHQQVRRWRDTDTLFNYTLQVNPSSLVSHNVFGYLAAKQHQYVEAESHYLKALQIWPEDATIQFNLGNLYFNDSQPERALDRYALAVKYQPRFVPYRNSLAAALARTGHPREAYDQWELAVAQDPGYIDARNNLADLLASARQSAQAMRQYEQVLALDPQNAHARQKLAELHGTRGN